MFGNSRLINFHVEIFCGLGQPRKYTNTKFVHIPLKMEDYLCVCGFHVYHDIYAVLGSVPPCVSTISGAVAIVCASFSPLPYLNVLLGRHLHFLILPSDCLSWYNTITGESEPLGSGKLSVRCRYCNRAIFSHTQLFV